MAFIEAGPRCFGFSLGFSLAGGLIVIVLISVNRRDIILISVGRLLADFLQIGDDEGLSILSQLNC